MSLRVDFTVAAIAERDGRFLIVQERAARRIVLNQPAGHLEDGESLCDAVVRETREETGRAFKPEALIGLYLWRGPTGRTVLRVAFAGSVAERDDSVPLDRAIIRTLWLGRAELAARTAELRSPLVMRCIDDYLQGGRYPLALLNHVPVDELPRLAAAPALR
ncbi:MAG TPA: NUDIX hydrolase [Steroidobacteraceae bacterium]|nr:NUDIX hydrolase [Steroidobacteraceae bacterium]